MSGRYRTVALQAIGVAVLAAVVFVAFLRPSEPGDLSGIDAPGGDSEPEVTINPPDDGKKKGGDKRNGDKGQNRQNRGNDRQNGGGGNANGRRGGGGPNENGNGDAGDTPPGGGDSPPDDQYT